MILIILQGFMKIFRLFYFCSKNYKIIFSALKNDLKEFEMFFFLNFSFFLGTFFRFSHQYIIELNFLVQFFIIFKSDQFNRPKAKNQSLKAHLLFGF